MNAQGAARLDEIGDEEILDVETSAALLRWMETASIPQGVARDAWEQWVDGGCQGRLDTDGVAVTPAMLGHWARTGTLR